MKNPQTRMRMLDGFNEGWIDFPHDSANARKGSLSAKQVIAALVQSATAQHPATTNDRSRK
jgi:hypothetical protein